MDKKYRQPRSLINNDFKFDNEYSPEEVIKKLKNVADSKETHQNAIELCLFKHQFVVNHINF